MIVSTALGSVLYIVGPQFWQDYYIPYLMQKKFYNNYDFLSHLPKNYEPSPERISFDSKKPLFAIVTGESGIGKTTEICHYAKQLKDAGEPVIYWEARKKDKEYGFEKFIMHIFGTTDQSQIISTMNKNFALKGKIATLIIDNVHLCIDDNGKIDEPLITFLYYIGYQNMHMRIIMLASVTEAADIIEHCN